VAGAAAVEVLATAILIIDEMDIKYIFPPFDCFMASFRDAASLIPAPCNFLVPCITIPLNVLYCGLRTIETKTPSSEPMAL